jgi:3-oxoadipate enol-lactonase
MNMSDTVAMSERAGATLVLINPIGLDAACWQFLDLEGAHPFEYPGHGRRDRQPGWTQEAFADEIVTHFDGPLDLIGVSMGGAVVGHVITRHPERVRSAVIACSGSVAKAASTPDAVAARRKTLLGRGERAVNGGMASILDETLVRWFTPFGLRSGNRGAAYARATLLALDPLAWNDIWVANADSEAVSIEKLTALTVPVTILGGVNDEAAGLSGLAQLHQLIPRSRFEVMAGSHMMPLEQPDSFMAVLDRHFLWATMGNRVAQPIGSTGWIDDGARR